MLPVINNALTDSDGGQARSMTTNGLIGFDPGFDIFSRRESLDQLVVEFVVMNVFKFGIGGLNEILWAEAIFSKKKIMTFNISLSLKKISS